MIRKIFANLRHFDFILLGAAFLLSLVGMLVIASVALSQDQPDFGNLWKQGMALAMGLAAVLVLGSLNYRAGEYYSRYIWLAGAALLLAVLFFGREIRGTTGWFVLGGWSFQPVEFAKVTLIVFLAATLSRHAYARDLRSMLRNGIGVLVYVALVAFQPDFGSALILLGLWGLLLLAGGIERKTLSVVIALALLLGSGTWFFGLRDYQRERILTFMNPARDPLGRGYNLTQSVIAVGSGGMFGRGFGSGSQSQLRFLPEAQTDFAFAVVAEELGFVAVIIVLFLMVIVFFRIFRIAREARDNYTLYLSLGVVLLLSVETVINIGMNLGVMPVTGIALPFVSYGGSSLFSTYILVGLVQSMAVRLAREKFRK
ncbi:hypothetical protein A3F28_01710 [Candidatus Uhrbacteria bacterium RIFCSPHIGHO2_12_FULL_57_11]|uniref:Rod shape-determining protein RodA n=2 Tax=Candidatus Uhriibacteriota TaxID=1752732 RepID=A0A1F7ULI1_9BACT|nr:MAG: hypothetical protein A3D72_02695 [Candidatus Uhrbacteria bacterium RIFCSPHIGHO2_02_FULL_57_19]OGL78604.1 MAG: hypothetical protein A3F28_01710 [Candidatus Uhrbacteria bacterium RIFCSPHIGHO2_12_FULL_57_11]